MLSIIFICRIFRVNDSGGLASYPSFTCRFSVLLPRNCIDFVIKYGWSRIRTILNLVDIFYSQLRSKQTSFTRIPACFFSFFEVESNRLIDSAFAALEC